MMASAPCVIRSLAITSRRNLIAVTTRRAKSTASASTPASATKTPQDTRKTAASVEDAVPIGASLLAAMAGITVVSATATTVEYLTADSCLPYHPIGQRFSQDEFKGRFSRMLLACDPRLLLYTKEQVRQAQELLEKATHIDDATLLFENLSDSQKNRTLWEARRITDAALHPDTQEVIPRPFRMSGFVPYNGPICVAMIASTSTPSLLFWSWVNQSQNALVNYYVSA